ncbi:MAG TPA: hypothetical protein VFW94_23500 [Candidatus Acidoferrales bacterium]|nr:hypothetical protein [Candidatus Acidoferrales bacterium]
MQIGDPYSILAFTLNHQSRALETYRHDLPFIEGDTRTIQYDGEEPTEQVFQGTTETGGWYDLD